jgi:PGF-pre-PGF domain-containing protein/PGF-CTERM protein
VTLSFEPSEADAGTDIPIDVLPTDGTTETVTVTVAEDDAPGGPSGDGAEPASEPAAITIPEQAIVAADSKPLVDATPEQAGIQVAFDETATVSEIGFENEGLSPTTTVEVIETETVPATVSPPTGTVTSAMQIDVSSQIEDESATIRFQLSAAEFEADPSEVELHRYDEAADSWSALETSVVNAGGDVIEFEAETPGFSLFAVTVQDADATADEPTPTEDPADEPTPADEPAPTDTPSADTETETPVDEPSQLPGFGVGVAIIALLAAALIARRHQRL